MTIQPTWLNSPFSLKFFVSENILNQEEISDPDRFLTGWLIVILVFISNFGEITTTIFDTMLKLVSREIYKRRLGSSDLQQLFNITM